MKALVNSNILWYNGLSGVACGTTLRKGGVSTGIRSGANLALHVGDKTEHVLKNREALANAISVPASQLVFCEQTHSANIACIDNLLSEPLTNTDGLITCLPGVALCILTADCLPVLLYDDRKKVVAALHAGWRGLHQNILSNAISIMKKKYGCKPEDIHAVIGPAISKSYYEVGADVVQKFDQPDFNGAFEKIDGKEDKFLLDISEIGKIQLVKEGIDAKHIFLSNLCTLAQEDLFFSARRNTINTGRMASFIMLS